MLSVKNLKGKKMREIKFVSKHYMLSVKSTDNLSLNENYLVSKHYMLSVKLLKGLIGFGYFSVSKHYMLSVKTLNFGHFEISDAVVWDFSNQIAKNNKFSKISLYLRLYRSYERNSRKGGWKNHII